MTHLAAEGSCVLIRVVRRPSDSKSFTAHLNVIREKYHGQPNFSIATVAVPITTEKGRTKTEAFFVRSRQCVKVGCIVLHLLVTRQNCCIRKGVTLKE